MREEEVPENSTMIFCEKGKSREMMIVINKGKVKAEDCKLFTKTLFSRIEAEKVLILDEIQLTKYYHSSQNEKPTPPFLRKLETEETRKEEEKKKEKEQILFLESPNVMDGLSASLISELEMKSKRGTVFVSLREMVMDDNTLVSFEKVLKENVKEFEGWKELRKEYSKTIQTKPKRSLFI